jgi:anhydro-N-acetylmuramic acid kinase
MFNQKFDECGKLAAMGIIDKDLFGMLKSIPYIKKVPPKSTGRDFLPENIAKIITDRYLAKQNNIDSYNLLRTLTEFTAWSIAENIKLFAPGTSEIIASGGGIHNTLLIESLSRELAGISIISTEETGLSADAKEAVCFAYLAYRTLGGLHGNMPSVTGASRKSILGTIAIP